MSLKPRLNVRVGAQKFLSQARRVASIGLKKFFDVEVVNDERDAPKIFLRGKAAALAQAAGVEKIFVSLSHSREFATAVCVLE